MKIISLTRAFIRKFARENQSADFSLSGPKLKIPLNLKGEPIETRVGFNPKDNSPYYESDPKELYQVYYAYSDSVEYHQGILYADVLGFQSQATQPIRKDFLETDELSITVDPLPYKLPRSLAEHGSFAVECFKQAGKISKRNGDWENNESLRIVATTGNLLTGCKASYFDQVATNLTLDWRSKHLPDSTLTIRNSIEKPEGGKLKPLSESNLANTLGVAVMLYNSGLEAFVRLRSDSLASIPKKGLHCSASGVFEMEGGIKPGNYDYSAIEKGIELEIKAEIGLDRSDYDLYPTAFARELPRGGKPQLFFIAITNLSYVEILNRSQVASESWEFVDDSQLVDEENKSGFRSAADINSLYEQFTYEGWACLQFAEDFLTVNKENLGLSCS